MSNHNIDVDNAKRLIERFSINYKDFLIKSMGDGNEVLYDHPYDLEANIGKIKFETSSKNSKVFIRSGARINNAQVVVSGIENIIYLGEKCNLGKSWVQTQEVGSYIFIGNNVTCTLFSLITAGQGGGGSRKGITIGDDCMFAHNVRIRSTDAHPIYDLKTMEHINKPKSGITIEPHVWLCENSVVLKDVTIGACSIIGLGSIVTSDIPRFSSANGCPAKNIKKMESIWTRNSSQSSIDKALSYVDKYAVTDSAV